MNTDTPHDLIIFGEDWGSLPSSTQHLAGYLARQRKIVWINSIGLRRPRICLRDIRRAIKKLSGKILVGNKGPDTGARNTVRQGSSDESRGGIHVIYPRTLPAPRSRLGRWIAARLLVSQILPVLQKEEIRSPILWTSLPTAVDVSGCLGESALVYYCGDDFSALAGVDHDTVAAREKELVEKADLIFYSSANLSPKFPPLRSQLLPHGVDYSLFTTPAPRAPDLPDDGRPVAGFYGSISTWLDIELLRETIRQLPDWHFVFIGKAEVDVSRLAALDNVVLLGERPHHLLPSYSQHWTASLLPFLNNAQIRACNPLKLSEYLAAGRPVISTAFPAIQHLRGLVQIASSSDATCEALTASEFLKDLPAFPGALRKTVARSSWSARANQVDKWMEVL